MQNPLQNVEIKENTGAVYRSRPNLHPPTLDHQQHLITSELRRVQPRVITKPSLLKNDSSFIHHMREMDQI